MTRPHRLLFTLTAAAIALSAASVFYPVDWRGPAIEIGGVLFFGVALMVPFILVWVFGRFLKTAAMIYALCALNVLLMMLWCALFGATFFWNTKPDAQDGLIFAVAPLYGIVLAAGFGGLIFLGDIALRASKQKQSPSES